ncbi:MAG: hypothetical protein NT133_09285 [Alphaproteobacteria bacterium]|nr:hypothetical protein [Alphaproteobacteria bacterium]
MISLGIIGSGLQAQALRGHGGPLGGIRLVDTPARNWRDIAEDPVLGAVLVDLAGDAGLAAIIAALTTGKIVVCPPAPAGTLADHTRLRAAVIRGGGTLLPCGELTHGEAARRGLAAIADPAFGKLTSLYIAIRQPRGPGDVLKDLAPEAVAFITAAIPDDFSSVRVAAGGLFGTERDSVVIILRSTKDVVVTIELAKCLPASLPAPGLGEVEIDAIGTLQAIRITPLDSAVRIHRDDGTAARPWLDAAVLAMLRDVERASSGLPEVAGWLHRAASNRALLTAIRAAAM